MKDTTSRSEHQAAKSASAEAWGDWQDEYAEPAEHVEHTCTSPDPARCLFCALELTIAEQKEERRMWDEYKASQRDEEAS